MIENFWLVRLAFIGESIRDVYIESYLRVAVWCERAHWGAQTRALYFGEEEGAMRGRGDSFYFYDILSGALLASFASGWWWGRELWLLFLLR